MSARVTTVRYVKALFAVAEARGERERVLEDLLGLGRLFDESPQLRAALVDPRLPAAARRRVLDGVGLAGASATVQDFADLCLQRNRAEVLIEAPQEFARLDREARGVVQATVESAQPLTEDVRASVRAKLEETTGKSVEIREEVLPDLIGGLRIRIGSRMYDGSVRRQLEELGMRLLSTRIG